MTGISVREFARREECSHTLVQKAVKTGHLSAFADGKLDPGLVGTAWRKGNREAATAHAVSGNVATAVATPVATLATTENPATVAERIIVARGATMTQMEAERVKENYLALLRQLEYDQKSATVADVADTARLVGEAFARVRTRLLAIPAEWAPQLHRCKTVAELQDMLLRLITEALEELIQDGPGAT